MVLTPIETYELKGRLVSVKRDDMVGVMPQFPPWAKIEGIHRLLASEYIDKSKPLIHLSVYGSWTGWVVAELCKELGLQFISAYPNTKKYPESILKRIEETGAELMPLKPNMMNVLDNRIAGIAKENGWQKLPNAFNHPIYISYMRERMKEVLETRDFDHLVVAMGSGVTAAGLIQEFLNYDSILSIIKNKRQVHSITMSSVKSTQLVLNRNGVGGFNNIHVTKSPFAFDDMMPDYKVPFECNEFWDKKMWYWLDENIEGLDGRILFWNIGGSYLDSI